MCQALDKLIEPIFGPERAGDIKHSNADIGKARELFGGILRMSIPYKEMRNNSDPYVCYDIGFQESLNSMYELIRTEEWQKTYEKGYFLLIAKNAFKPQILETSFLLCWTIWEHLFTILDCSFGFRPGRGCHDALKVLNHTWLRKHLNSPTDYVIEMLYLKMQGNYRYYGITDNSKALGNFCDKVRRMLFKWFNRRSQRKS
ncbi:MAG: hypothetical protein WC147_11785, partial [Syntrophomonas sp.]